MSAAASSVGDDALTKGLEDSVAAFVVDQLGCEVTSILREPAFATNAVFRVEADRRRFVVKASGRHDALRAEAWSCAQGAAVGCAAPAVLAFGPLGGATGLNAFVMTEVAGSAICGPHPVLREVGRALRRLHEVKLPRFGWLADGSRRSADDFAMRHDSWLGFLRDIADGVRRLAGTHGAAAPVATTAAAAMDAHAASLARVEVGSLCHGDLKAHHILVYADRLSGVIDWGDAVVGDPLWDVARFAQRVDASSLALLLEGYEPGGSLVEELAWKLPLYGVLWKFVDATVDHGLGRRVDDALIAAMGDLARQF